MTTVIVTKLAFRVLALKLFTVANLRHQLGWYYLITLLYSHTNAAPQIYPLYSSLFLSVYWRDNPRGMLWGHEKVCNSELEAIDFLFFSFFFRMVFPTSEDVYYADKPIWNVVCYFYSINFNFPWVYRCNQRLFLTNQGARSILIILQNLMIIIFK